MALLSYFEFTFAGVVQECLPNSKLGSTVALPKVLFIVVGFNPSQVGVITILDTLP